MLHSSSDQALVLMFMPNHGSWNMHSCAPNDSESQLQSKIPCTGLVHVEKVAPPLIHLLSLWRLEANAMR